MKVLSVRLLVVTIRIITGFHLPGGILDSVAIGSCSDNLQFAILQFGIL